MFCPNCGSQNNKKQNFCRYCGLHLQEIEKAFASQMVFGDETKRLKRLRSIRKATDAAQFFSSVLFFVGILGLIFFDSRSGKMLITAGLLSFFVAQAIRSINGRLQRGTSRQNVGVPNDGLGTSAGAIDTNKLLEDRPFESASSVTEHTTRELQLEGRERK